MILLEMLPYYLGAAHFACTMVLLIRWAILRTARTRNSLIRPDMHKYAAISYPKSFKVLAIIVIGGWLLVIFPAMVWAIVMAFTDFDPKIAAGITAALGLIGLIALARIPLCHQETSATVDSRGLTIEYQDGDKKTISVYGYKGYIAQAKKQAFRLVFEGDGEDEYIYLPFLSERDAIAVGKDLNTLRDHGSVEPAKSTTRQPTPPTNIPVRTQEETKKIEEKLAYTNPINAGADIEDQAKYRAYLEDVLKKIPFEKRDQIIKLTLQGKKAEAMRECQRAAGEGLRIVSDLFGNYLMFPDLRYFTCRIYVKNIGGEIIRESIRKYNGIYKDPAPCYISGESELAGNWHYVELKAASSDPTVFTFWDYMNILIWMTYMTYDLFAYAKPNGTYMGAGDSSIDKIGAWTNTGVFYATPNTKDQLGESVSGIMNGKEFTFNVPELTVSYTKEVAEGLDMEAYIEKKYGVKV